MYITSELHFKFLYITSEFHFKFLCITSEFHFKFLYITSELHFKFLQITSEFHFRFLYITSELHSSAKQYVIMKFVLPFSRQGSVSPVLLSPLRSTRGIITGDVNAFLSRSVVRYW